MDIAQTRSGIMISYGTVDAPSFVKWALKLPFEDQFDIYCVAQWGYVRERQRLVLSKKAILYWDEVIEGLDRSMPEASHRE